MSLYAQGKKEVPTKDITLLCKSRALFQNNAFFLVNLAVYMIPLRTRLD